LTDFSYIKSPVQAHFHLDRGELISIAVDMFRTIHIKKNTEKENTYDLAIVPVYGKSKLFVGNADAVNEIVSKYNFIVLKGATLEVKKKLSLMDRIITWWQDRHEG
jgi:hypothetical protein